MKSIFSMRDIWQPWKIMLHYRSPSLWASLVAQLVKNLPAMQEAWVRSLGWEDSLEKGKATHSSILAWRIPWTIQSMGSQRVGHDWATFTHSLWSYFVDNLCVECILSLFLSSFHTFLPPTILSFFFFFIFKCFYLQKTFHFCLYASISVPDG